MREEHLYSERDLIAVRGSDATVFGITAFWYF